jgi:hypothetical protein
VYNSNFKRIDFDTFKKDAGFNAYVFSIKKWNEELGGIGILIKYSKWILGTSQMSITTEKSLICSNVMTIRLEEQIDEVETQIRSIRQEEISGENVYQLLLTFDQLYAELTESEKKGIC